MDNGNWGVEPFVDHQITLTNSTRCVRTKRKDKRIFRSIDQKNIPTRDQFLCKLHVKRYSMRIITDTGQ